jgi:hypothetical protein
MRELRATASRQYIDAVSVFEAHEVAVAEAAQVRGGMYWHKGPANAPDRQYLVRTTTGGGEESLGARSPETERIFERFQERKQRSHERLAGLNAALRDQQRMNRALRVGSSMLGVLKQVDPTFRIRRSQKYTAVNKDGFEVDILRREQREGDPHPAPLSADEDDFWVLQARNAHLLQDAEPFSAVVVASSGAMARMNTLHPLAFVDFKRRMGDQADREALKRRRDIL